MTRRQRPKRPDTLGWHSFVEDSFALAADVVERPGRYPERFIAIPMGSPLASLLFSAERRRLMAALKARHTPPSVSELAKTLGRDATRVSRDLQPLIQVGLVKATRDGKNKRLVATNRPVVIQ